MALKKSRFRSSFKLTGRELEYINNKGMDKIKEHARDFINSRLKVPPKNDGKQTPWRGHPVFKAQHATGSCCRKCVEKWHKIPRDRIMTSSEEEFIVELLMVWIREQKGDSYQ